MSWTEERHKAVRDRLAAATEGPWAATFESADNWFSITGAPIDNLVCPEVATVEAGGDAEAVFIANSRADLADALGEIERLQALPAVEAVAKAWSEPGPVPGLHEQMRRNVRHDMPPLGRALDRLEQERKEGE